MRKIILLFTTVLLSFSGYSQDILMQNGTVNQCSGTFYDSGGPDGTYTNNENYVLTICPDGGDFIQADFTSFSTQLNTDYLYIYDGDDTTAPLIGQYAGGGFNSPGTVTASDSNTSGCLTFEFVSSGTDTSNGPGWAADIICGTACQDIEAIIESTNPAINADGIVEIPAGGTVDFVGTANFSEDGTGATYFWNFGNFASGSGTNVSQVFNNAGVYTVTLTVEDTNPTGCSNTTSIEVHALAPYLVVDTTSYTEEELVQDVLISGGCASIENLTFQGPNGIAYFNKSASGFPFQDGVLLSSGNAQDAEGPSQGNNSTGGWPGDAQLFDYMQDLGIDPGLNSYNDATYLEFDFIPVANQISFNFLFASEEYGTYQCSFSDAFAFFLTDMSTGVTTNLAIVPGTTDPVSVITVRDDTYNGGCASVNPEYFDKFYGTPNGLDPTTAAINYRGQTVPMVAFSEVEPYNVYKIKLVVADRNDSILNSAVFLEGGSFDLGGDLGEDLLIVTDNTVCEGVDVTLDTGIPAGDGSHVWYFDGEVIEGESNSVITINQEGTYSYDLYLTENCQTSDEIFIEFYPTPTPIDQADNLFICGQPNPPYIFDLTQNNEVVLLGMEDADELEVSYHNSEADANADAGIIDPADAYSGTDGEVIWVRVDYPLADCYEIASFTLNVIQEPIINPVEDMIQCDDPSNDGIADFDLETQTLGILGTQPEADFIVTYYDSFAAADSGTGSLDSPYTVTSSPQPIWVRVELDNPNTTCVTVSPDPVFYLIIEPFADTSFTVDPTCDGAVVTLTGESGGTFSFGDPQPPVAVIDPTTGEVTGASPSEEITIIYALDNECSASSEVTFNVIDIDDPSFTLTPTCDGATAEVTGTPGGTFTMVDVNGVGGTINPDTGEITGGPSEAVYDVTYTTSGTCPDFLTLTVTVPFSEDTTFEMTPNCSGATATILGDVDGTFSMVDLGDGASIDPATGEIIGGLSGATYTVTYAFANVCSEPTTLDVTVIVTDDPSFTLTPTCDGATAEAVTPGGTYAFTDPQPTDAVIDAATGTITGGTPGATYEVVYTTNGTCPDTTTNTVTVHPLPTLAQDPAELIVCDDNTPDGVVEMDLTQMDGPITGNNPNYVVSYHASQADADAGTPEVAPSADAYVGTDGEVVYVRVESVNTGCHTTTTLTLQVVGAPAANIPQALTYCDPDNDDLGEFDLDSTIEEITGGDTSLDVTFHLTYQNAVDDVLPQSSPLSNVLGQVIYVRVDYAGVDTDCPTIVELQLIVQPTPEIADPSPLELCDDAVADGMTQFDLTQANTEILNGLDPTLYTVTYYTEVADAEIGPSAPSYIAVPTAYTNQFTPQTLGVRVEDNATLCFRTTTLELIVNPLPTPAQTQEALQLSICDDNDDNDGYAAFDLTDQDGIITSGTPSWSVDYYETAIDRDNDNPIADYTSYTNTSIGGQPHNPQTIYVKVTDQDTGCYAYSTLTLEVSPLPTPTPAENLQDLVACDDTDTGDLSESFDLTVMEDSIILPGETGLTATYHTTEEGAEEGDTSIADATAFVNTQTPQTVWVRVTNDQTGCYNVTSFQVVVNPLPDASAELEDLIACELNTDGVYTFDLTQQDATILNGQDPSSYGVTYYTSLSGAQNATGGIASPWAFTNTVNPQEIFVNIMDLETRCDIATISFFVEVQEAAEANTPEPFVLCDDNMEFDGDPTDDSVAFDLSTQNATVLNGQDPANFTVSYYETEADALAMDNAIANPTSYMNLSNPQTVWVRVDNDTTPDSICYDITTLELQVAPIPSFVLEDVYVLCTDTNGTEVVGSPLMDTGLDASAYSFEWSEATDPAVVLGTDSSYMPTVAGTYTVVVTDVDNGCSSAMSAEVILSSPPVVQATVTTQAFADNHVVTVTATGATDAVFEFSIDNGPWVSNEPNDGSYVFENLSFGEHLVQVRDINGCGIGSDTVTVMDYPLFFTPNGDGDNDTWQIYNINTQVNAKIYIFDRYGKLLKQLSPTGEGWDGTYNGELMPSSDYWFTVEYTEPGESNGETKILKEHFTLKR